jgi:hypothetical protein
METITLYQVTCGLYTHESFFPPFAKGTGDWVESKLLVEATYNQICIEHFSKKGVRELSKRHSKTYAKQIITATVKVDTLKSWLAKGVVGNPITPEKYQEVLNEIVWAEGSNIGDILKDEIWDFDSNFRMVNRKMWDKEKEIYVPKI